MPKEYARVPRRPARDKRNLYYRDFPGAPVRDEVWRRFADALLPLDSAGKLGVILFQFPPWFLPGRESREHIVEAKQRLPQYRVAVEFRNDRWLSATRPRPHRRLPARAQPPLRLRRRAAGDDFQRPAPCGSDRRSRGRSLSRAQPRDVGAQRRDSVRPLRLPLLRGRADGNGFRR